MSLSLRYKKLFALLTAFLVAIPIFCTTAVPVLADTSSDDTSKTLEGYVVGIFADIISGIMGILVQIVLFLSHALIAIAKYNDFVQAPPVTIGWVLVRDIVNMFFIVVLLVVAFATIIGYETGSFHAKIVLPKLLLVAVLINFSKTLVGLMIDFSQVLTLTFVNGFQAAAGGNFIQAFQLMHIANYSSKTPPGGVSLLPILGAAIFGIMILVISCTTLTIMLLYFLVRVVVIWMLLIGAPLAFFGYALPEKLKKNVSNLTTQWWTKLSSVLTGGPIVAFYLWLSLAVIQSRGDYFTKMYTDNQNEGTGTEEGKIGISEAGDPGGFFSMIVCVALMLMGLKTAVDVSTELNPTLGAIAGQIKQQGGPIGYGAKLAGRGMKMAGKGVAYGAKQVARTEFVQQKAGQLLAHADKQTAQGNRFLGGALGKVAIAGLIPGAERQKEARESARKQTAHLTGEQKRQAARTQAGIEVGKDRFTNGVLGDAFLHREFESINNGTSVMSNDDISRVAEERAKKEIGGENPQGNPNYYTVLNKHQDALKAERDANKGGAVNGEPRIEPIRGDFRNRTSSPPPPQAPPQQRPNFQRKGTEQQENAVPPQNPQPQPNPQPQNQRPNFQRKGTAQQGTPIPPTGAPVILSNQDAGKAFLDKKDAEDKKEEEFKAFAREAAARRGAGERLQGRDGGYDHIQDTPGSASKKATTAGLGGFTPNQQSKKATSAGIGGPAPVMPQASKKSTTAGLGGFTPNQKSKVATNVGIGGPALAQATKKSTQNIGPSAQVLASTVSKKSSTQRMGSQPRPTTETKTEKVVERVVEKESSSGSSAPDASAFKEAAEQMAEAAKEMKEVGGKSGKSLDMAVKGVQSATSNAKVAAGTSLAAASASSKLSNKLTEQDYQSRKRKEKAGNIAKHFSPKATESHDDKKGEG